MSETLDFNQLEQHDFDLGVRDIDADHETRCKELFNRYGQLITGASDDTEFSLDEFEKVLSCFITDCLAKKALLVELNLDSVEPTDAHAVLKESIIPTDEIMDTVAGIRGTFETAVDEYTEQLRESGLTLCAPAGEQLPSDAETEEARSRLARYVITSILVDDREENLL
ncbi:hypothetical protein AAA64_23350 [Salmonella enterica subsp. enterica serovar Dublin]|jgi:hypothetical protein|nr:hypothetical protein [Salmonella enterica subsp. enterica serovar Dublin]DAY64716.1 MAG TPA: hypothetical protein [Caudoviricetes sp.]